MQRSDDKVPPFCLVAQFYPVSCLTGWGVEGFSGPKGTPSHQWRVNFWPEDQYGCPVDVVVGVNASQQGAQECPYTDIVNWACNIDGRGQLSKQVTCYYGSTFLGSTYGTAAGITETVMQCSKKNLGVVTSTTNNVGCVAQHRR
jgi:hypothetical protein